MTDMETAVLVATADDTDLFAMFETDKTAEVGGVWFNYGPDPAKHPGFLCRRAGGENDAYERAYTNYIKEHDKFIIANKKDPSPEAIAIVEECAIKAFLDTVLINWRNVKSKERSTIPFNREEATKLFKALPELFSDLQNKAADMANFKTKIAEDHAKN